MSRCHAALALMSLVVGVPLASAQAVGARAHGDVRALAVSAPVTVLELDAEKLGGGPSRLSWSDDGRLLYVRTSTMDLWGNERSGHYLVDVEAGTLRPTEGEPAWAAAYWALKSALAAPGVPGFQVRLETREERVTATGVQGALAPQTDPTRGSDLGPQGAAIASSVVQAQKVVRSTLKLHGDRIGEFVNTAPRLGLTFGWGPAGSGLIAFVDAKDRLGLMDQAGHRRQVPAVEDATLPAWSGDGRKIAVLEKASKKRQRLRIVTVSGLS